MVKKKPSIGRQRIPMAIIPKKSHRQVTFSKRRAGLFKKASELCTLCRAEIAIIVFSPAHKAFSFGHPEVDSIIDRFLTQNPSLPQESSVSKQLIETHRNANVRELNSHLTLILNELEAERKKGEALDNIRKAGQSQCWWEAPIDELKLPQLEQLQVALEELKKNIVKQANKVLVESTMNRSRFLVIDDIENVSLFESKQNQIINSASAIPHVYNFGYEHGHFCAY